MRKWAIVSIVIAIIVYNTKPGLADIPHSPHSANNAVTCLSCHSDILPIADRSAVCSTSTCHGVGSPLELRTHSAAVIHENEDPGSWPYGSWGTECLDCHDPHLHFQLSHLSQLRDDLYLVTGNIESISIDQPSNTTTVTYSSPQVRTGWELPVADWGAKTLSGRGLIFIADSFNPSDTFEIESATDTTVTLNSLLDSSLITNLTDPKNPTTFGIIYGQFIKSEIQTPNSGNRTVKFFDPNGGFVDGNNDPAPGALVDESATTTPEGVCQICHISTPYWKNDGTGSLHPDDGNIKCTDCHDHVKGFAASCESCHGYPPGALVFIPGSTNSSTAGVHDYHDTVLGFSCDDCHYNSVGIGPTHNSNVTVTMGFYSFEGAVQGGDYVGQAGVLYDATLTSPATTVSTPATDAMTCSNLYCHGNYVGSGKNATPIWNNDPPGSGACGTCHGASNNEPPGLSPDLTDGGHTQHAYNLEPGYESWPRDFSCSLCHNGIVGGSGPDSYTIVDQSKHVSSTVDWQFDTSDPRLDANAAYSIPSGFMEPSDGVSRAYGQCDNVYCHSNVQPPGGIGLPSVYDSPVWGDSKSIFEICIGCHNQEGFNHSLGISTGSHVKHVREYYFGMSSFGSNPPWDERKCTICHKWNDSFDTGQGRDNCDQCHYGGEKQYHVNGSVDIIFDSFAPTTATYTGTPTPGDGYGSCTNLYCHSDGTSVATDSIPANTSPSWGGGAQSCTACHAFPPLYNNGSPKANSHINHISNSCDTCHFSVTATGNTITDNQLHVNKSYDVQAGPGVSFVYTYDPAGGTCASISCHNGDNATWGSTSLLLACNSCHGYPPVPGDGFNVNDQFDGGKGVHVTRNTDPIGVGGHILNSSSLDPLVDTYGVRDSGNQMLFIGGYYECVKCHYEGEHSNGTVDMKFTIEPWQTMIETGNGPIYYDRYNGFGGPLGQPIYNGEPGNPYVSKTCSNIICHMGPTPPWGCPNEGDE